MNFSHSDHYGITCTLIKCCLSAEGLPLDINQFRLLVSTSFRRRKEVLREIYEESRASFRNEAVREKWPMFFHLDKKGQARGSMGEKQKGKAYSVSFLAIV